MIAQIAVLYSDRICVRVVAADEFFFVTAVRSNRVSCQSKNALSYVLFVDFLVFFDVGEVSVDLLHDAVLVEIRAPDEERILKVNLILLIV